MLDTELTTKLNEFVKIGVDAHKTLVERAELNQNFRVGKQWSVEEYEQYKKKGVIPLVINHCLPVINTLSGVQRQNKQDIKVRPRKGGTSTVADILTELTKHACDQSKAQHVFSTCFSEGITNGEDFLKLVVDKTDGPGGAFKVKRRSVFNIIPDPDNADYDLNNGRFVIDLDWVDKEEIELLYGDVLKDSGVNYSVNSGNDTDLADELLHDGNSIDADINGTNSLLDLNIEDVRKRKYLIKEVQWKQPKLSYVWTDIVNKQSRTLTEKKDIAQAKKSVKHMPEQFTLEKKISYDLHITKMLGEVVLEDIVNPMKDVILFSIIRFAPYWVDGYAFGVIDNIIDPQKEENTNRTQTMRLLNQTTNSGWIVKAVDSVYKKFLEKFGNVSGIVVEKDKCGGEVERISPNQLSTGHMALAQQSATDIKEISNVSDTMQGYETGKNESGKALQFKQRQSMTASEMIMDNFDNTVRIFGELMVIYIRKLGVYTDDEIRAIIAESKLVKPAMMAEAEKALGIAPRQPMNIQPPNPEQMAMLQPQDQLLVTQKYKIARAKHLPYAQVFPQVAAGWEKVVKRQAEEMMFAQLKSDEIGDYGIVVSLSTNAPTVRMANMAELEAIQDKYGTIPADIFIDATDLNNKDEIITRMKEVQAQIQQQAQQQAQMTQQPQRKTA